MGVVELGRAFTLWAVGVMGGNTVIALLVLALAVSEAEVVDEDIAGVRAREREEKSAETSEESHHSHGMLSWCAVDVMGVMR